TSAPVVRRLDGASMGVEREVPEHNGAGPVTGCGDLQLCRRARGVPSRRALALHLGQLRRQGVQSAHLSRVTGVAVPGDARQSGGQLRVGGQLAGIVQVTRLGCGAVAAAPLKVIPENGRMEVSRLQSRYEV